MTKILKRGALEVIVGGMFSGKSEELIRRVRRALYADMKIVVFKPVIDDRYSKTDVVSHNNNKIEAVVVTQASEIISYLSQNPEIEAVAVDEAQFFNEEIVKVCQTLADRGFKVIVAGLDMDFRGKPFSFMGNFMAVADKVTKLQAVCTKCKYAANRSQRLINGEPADATMEVIHVGADESYEARCRHCHEVW